MPNNNPQSMHKQQPENLPVNPSVPKPDPLPVFPEAVYSQCNGLKKYNKKLWVIIMIFLGIFAFAVWQLLSR